MGTPCFISNSFGGSFVVLNLCHFEFEREANCWSDHPLSFDETKDFRSSGHLWRESDRSMRILWHGTLTGTARMVINVIFFGKNLWVGEKLKFVFSRMNGDSIFLAVKCHQFYRVLGISNKGANCHFWVKTRFKILVKGSFIWANQVWPRAILPSKNDQNSKLF